MNFVEAIDIDTYDDLNIAKKFIYFNEKIMTLRNLGFQPGKHLLTQ